MMRFFAWIFSKFFKKTIKHLIEKELGDRDEHIAWRLHERHNEHINPKTGEKFKTYGFKLLEKKAPWLINKNDVKK